MRFTENYKAVSPKTGIVKDFTAEFEVVKSTIRRIIGINGEEHLAYGDRIETFKLPNTYKFRGKDMPITGIDSNVFATYCNSRDRSTFGIGSHYHPIGTLVIPDGIQIIASSAFTNLSADKVIWPSTCEIIPEGCFLFSTITEIKGIGKVHSVQERAFSKMKNLKEFNWPKGAKTIPRRCFDNCYFLEDIKGIENVESVEYAAFRGTSLKKVIWPAHCDTVPDSCFEGSVLEEITFPGSVVSVGHLCFASTKVKEINLENSFSCEIDESVGKQGIKVIEPFYQS